MEPERSNSPSTSAISLEVMGHQLQFSQDPNSKHLGTTVWDASMVFVKFLEKNCRKGRFCPSKLKGKRAIELGAGCGVAGFGMALLGCNVVATDQKEVLPLLKRNVERNISRILQMDSCSGLFGSIKVEELDWGNESHIRAVDPPFDYIVGTDVVYSEKLLEPFLQTVLALSGPKTTILVGYEIRSTSVHEKMLDMWRRNFEVKIVPNAKMDSKYKHQSIQLFIMGLKSPSGSVEKVPQGLDQIEDVDSGDIVPKEDVNGVSNDFASRMDDLGSEKAAEGDALLSKLQNAELTDWELRRFGSMAARLLRDVKIM